MEDKAMQRLLSGRTVVLVFTLLLAGCALAGKKNFQPLPPSCPDRQAIIESLDRRGSIPPETLQLLLVTTQPAASSAVVFACEKKDGDWVDVLPPITSVIGRSGFADPGGKKEGDGKTPSGVFRLETAFGYLPTAPTRMAYRQATAEDLWVDDTDSPDYNRWVKRGETAAAYEEMRRGDDLYKYGVVIEYNTEPVVRGNGSAIFLHIWSGEGQPTAGCVAMAEPDLLRILGWLDPAKKPVTVMGTEEILREMAANGGR
jgi:L,D-peptidoglycan transpeptidase YkuD (ErfK/YbiS/YcfS/YnhG family)